MSQLDLLRERCSLLAEVVTRLRADVALADDRAALARQQLAAREAQLDRHLQRATTPTDAERVSAATAGELVRHDEVARRYGT